MKFCANCFNDEEIKAIINGNNNRMEGTVCPNCSATDVVLYDTEERFELRDILEDFFDNYCVHDTGNNIAYELTDVWNIFNLSLSRETILEIIKAICEDYFDDHSALLNNKIILKQKLNSEFLSSECILSGTTWEEFQCELKEVNRYHSKAINLDIFKTLLSYVESVYQCQNTTFYRARISKNGNLLTRNDMGAPPSDISGDGRINARGVTCLYLATDEDTCIHEVRAGAFDLVTIGKFKIKRPIRLVDLSRIDKISPFKNNLNIDIAKLAINKEFLHNLDNTLRKPLSSSDNTLEYIATQYISDYIKSIRDNQSQEPMYDGIEYSSTHSSIGKNIALFAVKDEICKCECIDVKTIKINGLRYEPEVQCDWCIAQ